VTQFQFSRLAAASLAAAATLGAPLAATAQSVEVTKMCACWVTSLSADGSAATGTMNGTSATFRWTKEKGARPLGRNTVSHMDGQGAGIPTISDDGKTIAATIMDDTNTYGTQGRWTQGSGWQQLGPMPADGGIMDSFDSGVFGMSGDGKTVTGLYWRPGQQGGSAHGSAWTAATGVVGMSTDGRSSRIDGANRDGTVLAGWEEDPQYGFRRAAVWVNGVKTIIGGSGYYAWPSAVTAVNSDGTILVGQDVDEALQTEVATMWKWDGSAWQKTSLGLGPNSDPSGSSYAIDVSDDGSVVVGMYRTSFDTFSSGGFRWTADTGLVDVQAWVESQGANIGKRVFVFEATSVSHDGRSMSLVAQQSTAPYAYRSLLVTQKDQARVK